MRLCILAFILTFPASAQFVNAVHQNQANPGYVNGFSKWPEDKVTQQKVVNGVGQPAPAARPKPDLFGTPPAQPLGAGLPLQAREALETAQLADSDVTTSTDSSGAVRFTTTVFAQHREIPRQERPPINVNSELSSPYFRLTNAFLDLPMHSGSIRGK